VAVRAEGVATDRLQGVTFTLRQGEVLGVAGLENAGQTEFLRLFLGEGRLREGRVEVAGRPRPSGPAAAWAAGTAIVPRDRRREGLAMGRSIAPPTCCCRIWRAFRVGAVASARAERARAGALAKQVRLKSRGLRQPVRMLSGGNQQKVLFARAIAGAAAPAAAGRPPRAASMWARGPISTT
jgi:ribose transport system ATP-binding protein